MTGLDTEKDKILEVACLVTDTDLNIVAEGPDLIVHHPDSVLDSMSDWCVKMHGKVTLPSSAFPPRFQPLYFQTGLTEASRTSSTSLEEAEQCLLDFMSKHVTAKASPLAGNSVYMDRVFLQKFMPKVNNYLHYRIIDVSSVKELCRRWNGAVYKQAPRKLFSHRALADIHESVAELKHYKNHFFRVTSCSDIKLPQSSY